MPADPPSPLQVVMVAGGAGTRLASGNTAGKVAETGGASVFVVPRGFIVTPHLSSSILESITRRSVIELLADDFK